MERITIIGLGLIGGSIGLALKRAKLPDMEIVGHDREPEASAKARKRGAVDRTDWNLISSVEKASLVIVATPAGAVRETLAAIATDLPEGCIVTDTASTKSQVVAWAEELLPPTVSFVGGHPMAGRETPGIDAADPDLFKGATYCLTPGKQATSDAVETVVGLVRTLGATPYFLDAAEHDAFVAAVSHLPILVSTALVSTTVGSPSWREMARLAATGYRDVSRLASGDPVMHRDICLTNGHSIIRWIDAYIEELRQYRALIAAGGDALHEKLAAAQQARDKWIADREDGNKPRTEGPSLQEEMAGFLVGRRFFDRSRRQKGSK